MMEIDLTNTEFCVTIGILGLGGCKISTLSSSIQVVFPCVGRLTNGTTNALAIQEADSTLVLK